jgi:ubiquinol-cytochrome c reductase cytochrome b subunit
MSRLIGFVRAGVVRAWGWVHDRAGLAPILRFLTEHRIPREVGRTRKGWLYVFGQALAFVFVAQLVTGSALAMKYIPSPGHAWESLQFINTQVLWGGFVRGLHYFGASAMVILVFVHMARVFLTGSYKFPRELGWITGVALLFLTLAMAFTGQLLRWDHDGVATVEVAATMLGRFPLVGPHLMDLVLAGDTLGGATLSRFFALHVIVFPLLMMGLMGVHIYLVIRNGISEPPRAGEPVDRAGYRAWYARKKEEEGSLFWPDQAFREFAFIGLVYATVFGLAFLFGPKGPGLLPDPAMVEVVPRPDWYFLWYYALIWYKPTALDALVLVWFPVLVFPLLVLLPLLFGGGERAPSRRPWAVFAVGTAFLLWATLTAFGLRAHWIPDFETEPVPAALLEGADAEVRMGAAVFYDRGCQYCHVALDRGGIYGPDLNAASRRLTPEEMTVRILVGVGNMPAYQGILGPGEVEALLAYIRWAGTWEGRGGGGPSGGSGP